MDNRGLEGADAHHLVAVAGVVLALRNLVGAELGDRPVGHLRFKVTYRHIGQREKLFSWRLSARHQRLKQPTSRASADAPEVAK